MKRFLVIFVLVFLGICFVGTGDVSAANDRHDKPVADEMIGASGITWMPKVTYGQMVLTVSRPDGTVFSKTFISGSTPYLDLSSIYGDTRCDGLYTYELQVGPAARPKIRTSIERAGLDQEEGFAVDSLSQTGYFLVQGGAIVTGSPPEGLSGAKDILHYDDVIITGSLCVGFDCQDGESFGFDTIILKEHNLRIYFNDTSYTASYPTNNWRITINDSTNGGASYFSVDDVDDGTSIFKIEAGAPSNSLYVEDYGRVGLGTSTPVVELHIKDSDTPTLRLEQDSSGGWTAQTFDVAGNESNFFVRDATNGSKLPFRIQPSTPSSTLCLKSDGYVGIGTWSPAYSLELETTSEDAVFAIERTDGATGRIVGGSNAVQFGSITDHKVHIVTGASSNKRMTIDNTNGYVGIGDTTPSYPIEVATANGARLETSGNWVNPSSRDLKENIETLTTDEALETLAGLSPVKYNYKIDKTEGYVGFIAEDVPELVAVKDRKGMITMDVVAVLTKVVQEQQKFIQEQQKINAELKKKIAEMEKK
jgi:hypothetical protein